jgi:broad specificity phosphatase PhoE
MAVSITYFVHSTTPDNEQRIASGWRDTPLSETGIEQARKLSELTSSLQFDAIYTSDLSRTIVTAEIAWGTKFPIISDARLRECNYGDYDGQPNSIVEPIQKQSITTPFPNGESYEMVRERIGSLLTDFAQKHNGGHIALVGHKAPQLALDVLLKKMTWEDAFANDWRKRKAWQPGWNYTLE